MKTVSLSRIGKLFKLTLACLFFGVIFSFTASAATIKCSQTITIDPGATDKNEYALNMDTGCSELILDVSKFDAKISNLTFDAHDINKNYVFDVTYLDGSVYKELYLDKDVESNGSNSCLAYKDVVQPKYDISACFKEITLGINQQTKMIKISLGTKAGETPKSTEYAYFRNLKVNTSSSTSSSTGNNYGRINNDFICGNYRFHDLDAVFTGQVTSITDLVNGDNNYPELKKRYRFEVEKVLKGNINTNEKLILLGENATNVLSDDKYYIVYAQQLRDDKFKPICIKQLYSPDDIPDYLTQPFDDIDNVGTFQPYIIGLYYNGIVSGYGNSGMYYPSECVKRSHLAKFLVNTFNFDINTSGAYFPDVIDGNSELDLSIMTLYNLGIVRGYGNGYYMPDECVTREQAAAFIVRALQVAYPDMQFNGSHNFPDINGSAFALYIAYLYNIEVDGNRVINGNSNGYFEPNRPLSRGEMAKMMYLIWLFKGKYRDVKGVCFRNGGSWIDGAKECEGLAQEICLNTKGTHSCQSRTRVRAYEEEEVEISVQSSCGAEEVSVCSYLQDDQPSSTDPAVCEAQGNVYVACAPCKIGMACAAVCNLVNKCVTKQGYCEQYLGGVWNGSCSSATVTPIPTQAVPETRCRENGGAWIADSNQCNGLAQNTCTNIGGIFDRCGSACGRNYRGGCAKICALACYF